MATQIVPATNIHIEEHIAESTACEQTTNLSLKSLCSGLEGGNSITNTFDASGGKAGDYTAGSGYPYLTVEDPPFAMSECIGG